MSLYPFLLFFFYPYVCVRGPRFGFKRVANLTETIPEGANRWECTVPFAVGLPMSPIPSWTCGQYGCWGLGVEGINAQVLLFLVWLALLQETRSGLHEVISWVFLFGCFRQCCDLCFNECRLLSPTVGTCWDSARYQSLSNFDFWNSNHSGFFQPFSAADSGQTYSFVKTGADSRNHSPFTPSTFARRWLFDDPKQSHQKFVPGQRLQSWFQHQTLKCCRRPIDLAGWTGAFDAVVCADWYHASSQVLNHQVLWKAALRLLRRCRVMCFFSGKPMVGAVLHYSCAALSRALTPLQLQGACIVPPERLQMLCAALSFVIGEPGE